MGTLSTFDCTEDRLIWFCKASPDSSKKYTNHLGSDKYDLAPSRTLSKAQDLFMDLLPISNSFDYLRHSIRSVSGSYLKHEFPEVATLQWRVLAISGLKRRLEQIRQADLLAEMKPILGSVTLLLQYAVCMALYHLI